MSGSGELGAVQVRYAADTRSLDAGLLSVSQKSDIVAAKIKMTIRFAQMMGEAFRSTGPVAQRAAEQQERTADRIRRAWEKSERAATVALKAQAEGERDAARAAELLALKNDILARSEQQLREARLATVNQATVQLMRAQYEEAQRRADADARATAAAERMAGMAGTLAAAEDEEAAAAERSTAAHAAMNGAMAGGIPQYAATSAMVRLMEGNMNNMVRAAERFVGAFSGLASFAMKAFPVIGAVAMTDLLVRMARKAWDAYENVGHLREAFQGLAQDEIAVANATKRMQDSTEGYVEDILQKMHGEPAALQQRIAYQSAQPLDMSSYFYSPTFKKLPDDVKAHYESLYKNIAPQDIGTRLHQAQVELQQLHAALESSSNPFAAIKTVGGVGPAWYRGVIAPGGVQDYWKTRIKAMEQIRAELQAASDERGAKLQALQVDLQSAQQKSAPATVSSGYGRFQSDQEWERLQQHLVWQRRIPRLRDRALRSMMPTAEDARMSREGDLLGQRMGNEYADNVMRTGERWRAYNEAVAKSAQIQQQNEAAIRKTEIALGVQNGTLSRQDALMLQTRMHAQQYLAMRAVLVSERNRIASDGSMPEAQRQTQMVQIGNQLAEMQGRFQVQQLQDMAYGTSGALSDLKVSANRLTREFADSYSHLGDLVARGFSDVNREAIANLTVRNYRSNWGGVGADVARGMMGMAMTRGEGELMRRLGLGKSQLGASEANAMWVRFAGVGSAAAGAAPKLATMITSGAVTPGSTSGLMKSAAKIALSAIPGFASGGTIPSGMPAIVGEAGPELLPPVGHPRTVVPNGQWGLGGGHTFNIDARGATDPAATAFQIQRAMQQVLQQVPAISLAAHKQYNRNRPGSSRL